MNVNEKYIFNSLLKIYTKLKKQISKDKNPPKIEQTKINTKKLINYIETMIDCSITTIVDKKVNEYISKNKPMSYLEEYEPLLQKYEAEIRDHFKYEHENKLIMEDIQEQNNNLINIINELQNNNSDSVINEQQSEIYELQAINKKYLEQINELTHKETELKLQIIQKEKEILKLDNKYKNEIKSLKQKINTLESIKNISNLVSTNNSNPKTSSTKGISNNSSQNEIQTIQIQVNKKMPPLLNNVNLLDKSSINSIDSGLNKKKKIRCLSANKVKSNVLNSKNSLKNTFNNTSVSNISTNRKNSNTGISRSSSNNKKKQKKYFSQLKNNDKLNYFLQEFYKEKIQKKKINKHIRNKSTGDTASINVKKFQKIIKNKNKNNDISHRCISNYNTKKDSHRYINKIEFNSHNYQFSTINGNNVNKSSIDFIYSSDYNNTVGKHDSNISRYRPVLKKNNKKRNNGLNKSVQISSSYDKAKQIKKKYI